MRGSRSFSLFLATAVLAMVCSTAGADLSVLIVAADNSIYVPSTELMATGLISSIDVFQSDAGTPTLGLLDNYDAILAYTNRIPLSPVALGDVLADYVDAGGHLVLSTYAFSGYWDVQGRITDAGYSPLTNLGTNGNVSGNLDVLDPADPIFDGVDLGALTYFENSNFAHPGLDSGATLLATDGAGVNMIARNATNNVIGLNLFPGTSPSQNNAEVYQVIANALQPVPIPAPAAVILGMVGFGMVGAIRKRFA